MYLYYLDEQGQVDVLGLGRSTVGVLDVMVLKIDTL